MLNRQLEYRITGRDLSKPAFVSAQRSMLATEERLRGIANAGNRARSALAGITFSTFGAGVALRDLGRLETTMIRLRGLSRNFADDQRFISQAADDLGTTISGLAGSFADLSVLENIGLIQTDQVRALAIGFEDAARRFGTTEADIRLGIRGIRQALTQRIVRAQEFDQIFDALGAIQPQVAAQLGLTTEAFQQLRSANSLLATDLVDALVPALQTLEGSAARAAQSIPGANRRIVNSYEDLLLTFQEPVSTQYQEFAEGVAGLLDSIAENSDTVIDVTNGIGVALAAAFGGRAVAGIASFIAAQGRSITLSAAHSQALQINADREARINNNRANAQRALLAQQAQQVKFQQQQVAANAQQIRAIERTTNLNRANIASVARLSQLKAQQVLLEERLTAASAGYAATQSGLIPIMTRVEAQTRRAAIAQAVLTRATTAATAAMSLFGGPVGVITIALGAAILKFREATKVTRDLKNAADDAALAFRIGDQERIAEIEDARLAGQQQLNKLIDQRLQTERAISDVIDNGGSAFRVSARQKELFAINKLIEEQRESLRQIAQDRSLAEPFIEGRRAAQAFADDFIAIQNRLATASRQDAGSQGAFQEIVDDLLPDRSKVAELEAYRIQLREFQKDGIGSAQVHRDLARAINEQLEKLDPLTKKREEEAKAQEKALESLKRVRTEALSEVARIEQELNDRNQLVLDLQLRVGEDALSDNEASALISRYNEIYGQRIKEIREKDAEDEKRLRKETFDEFVATERAKADLLELTNPTQAIESRFELEKRILDQSLVDREISLDQALARFKALEIQNAKDIASAIRDEANRNPVNFSEFVRSDAGNDAINRGTSALINLLTRDVGSYIEVQDAWTDAEKRRAEESNRINQRAFQQNKRWAKAEAIIHTGLAVTKALSSTGNFYINAINAATAAAIGLKNIRTIDSTSFGGGAVNFGTGSTTAGSTNQSNTAAQTDISQQNANGGGTIIYMVNSIPSNLEQGINRRWLQDQQRRNIAELVDSGAISASGKTQIIVSDVPVPTLMRRNNNLSSVA